MMDHQAKEYGRLNIPNSSATGDVFEPSSINDAKQRTAVIEWLNSTLPNLNLPVNASDEELRTLLADGTILCRLLNKLRPGSIIEHGNPHHSSEAHSENVKKFLAAMDDMRLPHFNISELNKGSMKIVLESLLTLKAHFMPNVVGGSPNGASTNNLGSDAMRLKHLDVHGVTGDGSQEELSPRTYTGLLSGEDRRMGGSPEPKGQRKIRSPGMDSTAFMHHSGHKFHEVFQMKQGGYADLPASKISELMKSNSLDNAPTQSLLSMVNGILDESINRKNGEIPHRVACLLRKVVQEIERRISTQAEHLRTQNNLFKTREDKYQSRIRVLEALANGTGEESKAVLNQFDHMTMAVNQLDQIKTVKTKTDEEKQTEEKKTDKRKMEEKKADERRMEEKKADERRMEERKNVEKKMEEKKTENQYLERRTNEKDVRNIEIAALKQEMENAKILHEEHCLKIETAAKEAQLALEGKLKEVENYLNESKRKVQELEQNSQSKKQWWTKKEHTYKIFTEFQLGALKELRFASQSVRQEILETQKSYSEDFDTLGSKMKILQDAADSYHGALVENRKLHNEIQELKGNIRVYCRVRPFLPGQSQSQTTIDYIGDNGEIIVVNPSKQGKDGRKSFKFNKVYGPRATQGDVYGDIQALVQSVLDGYNVCIFAYGQTGSGKTYTMSGPDKGSEEDWGVNYRALNDLFKISQSRKTLAYEVGVQMVEIYNEQVRDLLSNDPASKRLGILSSSQATGLAVPDASMRPVNEPSDVLGLMEIGFNNRARSSTSMNARSSRSHSVVTIHVHGSDMKSGASLRGSLHLVDLAGSERIDRSEVIGDRLKEAQHINKSLAALGDVIFSLAAKSPHVPFRNSKLTQVLQSSLGGQAKTLMFVQLNPEVASYSETVSTLKFAERVSGVELGAARTNKEASNIKELMEQVASLKDTLSKKDEEIERLQLLKENKATTPKRSLRYGSTPPSPTSNSIGGGASRRNSGVKVGGADSAGHSEKSTHVRDKNKSDSNGSFKQRKESVHAEGQDFSDDAEMLFGFGDQEYSDRLSDASHASLSIGTDTEGSVESSPAHESFKRPPSSSSSKSKSSSKISRPLSKISRDLPRVAKGMLKSASGANLSGKPSKRWS